MGHTRLKSGCPTCTEHYINSINGDPLIDCRTRLVTNTGLYLLLCVSRWFLVGQLVGCRDLIGGERTAVTSWSYMPNTVCCSRLL